uniref:Uncharacterized protein n=1 Tax=Arundo donax TaxID=35708 RepID=A0A0A9HFZ6_ARUDO
MLLCSGSLHGSVTLLATPSTAASVAKSIYWSVPQCLSIRDHRGTNRFTEESSLFLDLTSSTGRAGP